MKPLPQLRLSFRGTYPFDLVREALGDALTALGDAPAPWVEVTRRALDDRNYAGAAFEGTWRRGDATLTMSAATSDASGNPRDGYGYDTAVVLESPRLAFTSNGGSMDGAVNGLHVSLALTPEMFKTARTALAKRLDRDESDRSWTAVANLEALDGVDRALQVELLTAALANDDPSDSARVELMKWKEKLLGGGLVERLRECPVDLDAWTKALASPPEGFSREHILTVCARLAPWDPSRPQHPIARAWQWLPALGGDGEAPPGWVQLDDGANPTWERPGLASQLALALLGLGAGASSEVSLGHRTFDDHTHGGATGRASWSEGQLPRVHVAWVRRQAKRFDALATVDWLWGDGPDDVVVLASRRQPAPPSPAAMFLAGTDAFRAAVMRALHAIEPFAWRPTPRPMERPFARARPPAKGSRKAVRALFAALGDAAKSASAMFEACRCRASDGATCSHEKAIFEMRRGVERQCFFTETDRRTRQQLDALAQAYQAAERVRTKPESAAFALDRGWRSLSIAKAITDPRSAP